MGPTYVPPWSNTMIQQYDYGRASLSPRSGRMMSPRNELAAARAHLAQRAMMMGNGSPRMQYARPPQYDQGASSPRRMPTYGTTSPRASPRPNSARMPFHQPSLPTNFGKTSPRLRPTTARNPGRFQHGESNFPRYAKPLPLDFFAIAEKKEADRKAALKAAQEAAAAEEIKQIVEQAPKREWGELPPGVTPDDLRQAALQIKEKLIDKFGSLQRAFRAMDADASGTVDIDELMRYLEIINLQGTRRDVIQTLFETIDADASGNFDFKEFARVMSAGDVMKMAKVAEKVDGIEEHRKKMEAEERKRREYKASLVGMTYEEYEEYWGADRAWAEGLGDWGKMTSAEVASKFHDGGIAKRQAVAAAAIAANV